MNARRETPRCRHRQRGLAYVEVLVATVLVAVALAPALDALRAGMLAGSVHEAEAVGQHRLAAKMEELLAQPLAALDAVAVAVASPTIETSYSDPAGTPGRRLVYLARYDADDADGDGDPFTGADQDLLWVAVALEGTPRRLESLSSL